MRVLFIDVLPGARVIFSTRNCRFGCSRDSCGLTTTTRNFCPSSVSSISTVSIYERGHSFVHVGFQNDQKGKGVEDVMYLELVVVIASVYHVTTSYFTIFVPVRPRAQQNYIVATARRHNVQWDDHTPACVSVTTQANSTPTPLGR